MKLELRDISAGRAVMRLRDGQLYVAHGNTLRAVDAADFHGVDGRKLYLREREVAPQRERPVRRALGARQRASRRSPSSSPRPCRSGAAPSSSCCGSDFCTDHAVSFDGNVFPTTFVSSEELRADVPGIALGGRARTVDVLALLAADPALRSSILMFQVTDRKR